MFKNSRFTLSFSLLTLLLLSPPGFGRKALLEVGSEKQFFFDDYLIESMVNARHVLNPARKAPLNPVIRADRPWERALHYGTGFYDDMEGQFRMWYTSSRLIEEEDGRFNGVDTKVLYATSRDGYLWEKPSLGLVDFEGSKENNILTEENWPKIKGGIFIDPREVDPARRYKAMAQIHSGEGTVPGAGESKRRSVWNLYYSEDAFRWTPHPENPVITPSGLPKVNPEGEPWAKASGWYQSYLWGPTASVGWDPIRRVYAMHMENCAHRRCPMQMRIIGRSESSDLVHWSDPQTILVPDDRDPPGLQFYSMWTSVYEGIYVGMLWNYRPGERTLEHPLHIWPQFVFSRDGIHYDRRYRDSFIANSSEPEWDSVTIYAQQPIVHNDKIFIYYNGTNFRDRRMEELGDVGPIGAIGLASIPLDRFAGVESGAQEQGMGLNGKALQAIVSDSEEKRQFSVLTTRPFSFSGKRLLLNMEPSGPGPCEVRVEVLTGDHYRVVGHTFEAADPMNEDSLANEVSWNGNADVTKLAGHAIKLKMYFKNARLFSFQFTD